MLTKLIARYLSREDGATAIEYGLIAAGIAVVISAAVFALGGSITNLFTEVGTTLDSASTGGV
ncbi:MAG: Flp family type IVb pilin [Alphaproteobacteria bacterium]|nr:Flp family type IVb pilin [Alphaproteobacteria bacterium]